VKKMRIAFELVATLCTGIFAGAAAYVSFVEHPARIECGKRLAITQFGPSYRRGAVMQGVLAALAFLAAIGAWVLDGGPAWLFGGILIVAVIPFTLIAIFPTNKRLLDPYLVRSSEAAGILLRRWGRLHAVRTVLGVAASGVFTVATLVSTRAQMHPSGDSIRGARESLLRQDLLTLRREIKQYAVDLHRAPRSLDDLVTNGYIKQIPADPTTGKPTWGFGEDPTSDTVNVHSLSSAKSSDGTAYDTW